MPGESSLKQAANSALTAVGTVKLFNIPIPPSSQRCIIIEPKTEPDVDQSIAGVVVIQGKLENSQGGFADAASGARARVIAVPGPDCTLRDIASAVLPLFQSVDPATPVSLDELTCAIFGYNALQLFPGGTTPPTLPAPPITISWKVGDQLTLPVEIQDSTDPSSETWATDLPQILILATDYSVWRDFLMGPDPGNRAAELPIPSPTMHYCTDLDSVIPQPSPIGTPQPAFNSASFAATLKDRLLANACECVFFVAEAMRRLTALKVDNRDPDPALNVIVALFKLLEPHHAMLLGALSGGNAMLRLFYSKLENAREATPGLAGDPDFMKALRQMAKALGLVPHPIVVDAWLSWRCKDPKYCFGPTFTPLEPPLAQHLRTIPTASKTVIAQQLFEMALGRLVSVSNADSKIKEEKIGAITALSLVGNNNPSNWIVAHLGDTVDNYLKNPFAIAINVPLCINSLATSTVSISGVPVTADRTLARMQLTALISPNEGYFDSTQAGDAGIVSFGMQQWAAHDDQNLTVLWERFRTLYPDLYDLFLGMWGLGTRRWVPGWAGREQLYLFSLDSALSGDLDNSLISSDLKNQFKSSGIVLSDKAKATVVTAGSAWTIDDSKNRVKYSITSDVTMLNVYNQPSADAIDAANSFSLDPEATVFDPSEADQVYFPTYATFVELPVSSPQLDAQSFPKEGRCKVLPLGNRPPRRPFFLKDSGRAWCARARLAALCSPDYLRIQVHTAAWRLTWLQLDGKLNLKTFKVSVDGAPTPFAIPQLFPSWVAAAAILDQHINAPGWLMSVSRKGDDIGTIVDAINLNYTPLTKADIDPASGRPKTTSDWYRRFITIYLAIRRLNKDDAPLRNRRMLESKVIPGSSASSDPMDPFNSPDFPGW